jgi:hypothetical protein
MDPNPIKHEAVLLAYVRDSIEPSLIAAGFHFDSRNKPPANHGHSLWIGYSRGSQTLSVRFDRWIARLAAELLDNRGDVRIVAEVHFDRPRSHSELMRQVDPFIEQVRTFLEAPSNSDVPSSPR